jgi:FkbM family methyltransferase
MEFDLEKYCTLTPEPIRGKRMYCLTNDRTIGRVFLEFKEWWEYWLIKYIHYLYLKYTRGTNMIDIGANIGAITAIFHEVCDCKVYSFEPIYYEILRKNVEINNMNDKVEVFDCAIGDVEEVVNATMYRWDVLHNFGQISLREDYPPVAHGEIPIRLAVRTLDSFGFENVGMMKIDVEGFEEKVLQGARETIRKNHPIIFIEILNREMLESEIFQFLRAEGYFLVQLPYVSPDKESEDYVLIPSDKCDFAGIVNELAGL